MKYSEPSSPIKWFLGFLYCKLLSDLFGVLNYTDWIIELLTRPVLRIYRILMGPIELGMLACFFLFSLSITLFKKPDSFSNHKWYLLLPAILLIPINFYLALQLSNSLIGVFLGVRLIFLGTIFYLLVHAQKDIVHRIFLYFLLAWNLLWFTEVLFTEALGVMSTTTSWILFVLAELCLTIGVTYYLIQIIKHPRIFRFENIDELIPSKLQKRIQVQLDIAIKEDKIYQDAALNLNSLALHLDVSAKDLTLFLNRFLGLNFNQFLTQQRIKESKYLLITTSKKELNIEQIMFQVGFNSKSVFNTAFKADTGMTPSAYRKAFSNES